MTLQAYLTFTVANRGLESDVFVMSQAYKNVFFMLTL